MGYIKNVSLDEKHAKIVKQKDFSLSKFLRFCLNDKAILNKYKKHGGK